MLWIAFKKRIRDICEKLSNLDARPDQIASGFCIGIIAGLLPLNPDPIIVATAAAWLLKRNVIAAIAGGATAILYLPLVPVIWLAEYRLGELILPVRHPVSLDHARLWDVLRKSWDVYAAMFVGSVIIAVPITVISYLIIKRIAERWAQRKNESQHLH